MKRQISLFLLVAVLLSSAAAQVQASSPKELGKFGYWAAYQMYEGPDPVCYMTITAKPPAPKGKKSKRGDVVLMLSHRPKEGATDVISYAAGTKFKPSSDVQFKVGKQEYSLFTQGDTAWARDSATDKAVAAAFGKASSLSVYGKGSSGEAIADTVALKGFGDAYYAIGKACGLSVEKPKAEKKAASKPKTTEKKP